MRTPPVCSLFAVVLKSCFAQCNWLRIVKCALFPILLSVLSRTHPGISLKYLHKISVIIIPKLHGNVFNGVIGGQQKLLCPQDPLLGHVFQHRHVGFLFEKPHHVLGI